jgi:type IV secretory pathway VirB4 component
MILMEMFLGKLRKLPGIRKVLVIDEAWKAIANAGMAALSRNMLSKRCASSMVCPSLSPRSWMT